MAGDLNISASNIAYAEKLTAYQQSSLMLTQALGRDYPDFRLEEVDARSRKLAEQAMRIWPLIE
jgi:hypothetical protein